MGDPGYFFKYFKLADFARDDESITPVFDAPGAQSAGDSDYASLEAPGTNASLIIDVASYYVRNYSATESHDVFRKRIRTGVNSFVSAIQYRATSGTQRFGTLARVGDLTDDVTTLNGAVSAGASPLVTLDADIGFLTGDYALLVDTDGTTNEIVSVLNVSPGVTFNVIGTLNNSFADGSTCYRLEWYVDGAFPIQGVQFRNAEDDSHRVELLWQFQTANTINSGNAT